MNLGKEQFANAFTEFRNMHIMAAMKPLIDMRTELIANDEFMARGGTDDPTRDNLIELLMECDRLRRHVTHNPDEKELGDKIAKAIDPSAKLDIGENPFGGDDIQNQSGGIIPLPYSLDGTDVDIPLNSQLQPAFRKSHGMIILGAIDGCIVSWTRMNSRDRTNFITHQDSMRIYGSYQQLLGFFRMYLGDVNRKDMVQVLPSQEPQGPTASPNLAVEAVRGGSTTT